MPYNAIAVEGGLLPGDLLDHIATGEVEGQSTSDFGLPSGTRLADEIQSAFSDIGYDRGSFDRHIRSSSQSHLTLTRRWMVDDVLERLGWTDLVYQQSGLLAGGDLFVISHLASPETGRTDIDPPIDVVAVEQSLGVRRPPARRSPYASVQEYLNRSEALWGMVTNGDVIWLLRDSNRVAHPTYVEFDLAAMIRDNLYSEFVLLYRLLHRSRFPSAGAAVESCLLEQYYQEGIEEGGRVRDHLRDGVEEALKSLGSAFLAPENTELRQSIESGRISPLDYYRQLLRLVYRLLFLLVVEERKLLMERGGSEAPGADETQIAPASPGLHAGEIYARYYSLSSLRARSESPIERDTFSDLWEGMKRLFACLSGKDGDEIGLRGLGLSPLNGELFGPDACRDLEGASCSNVALLRAIRRLTTFRDGKKVRRRVNFRDLDVEELGSVYESLLEFHPHVDLAASQPFDLVAGSERKQTGSYYTPSSLVRELIESALVPVIKERLSAASGYIPGTLGITNLPFGGKHAAEQAILSLKVCDPASGSGHFLLAAARRLARELAIVRSAAEEPSPAVYRQALRDVIRQCIYAVDRNPLAVDLCKVALWIEGYNSGLPLSFLDNHVRCGDSLVGVFDLEVLEDGIPDGAYTPVTGDDKAAAAHYKKLNKKQRDEHHGQVFLGAVDVVADFAPEFAALAVAEERAPYETNRKASAYDKLRSRPEYLNQRIACDMWTAAFFLPMQEAIAHRPDDTMITTNTIRRYLQTPNAAHGELIGEVGAIATRQPFFHWPLEFPEVFAGKDKGFDVVLGNPPWEQLQPEEIKFFAAAGRVDIARLAGATRKRAMGDLSGSDPNLFKLWNAFKREMECSGKFIRGANRSKLTAIGKLNTYSLFAEVSRAAIAYSGRVGYIVPTGIATDDTTKDFFADLMKRGSLVSLFDFENRKGLFPAVDSRMKFCLLTLAGRARPAERAQFAFFLHDPAELSDQDRTFTMSEADIALVNPNTHTAPIFRTRRDAEITKAIYGLVPVLIDENKPGEEGNPWSVSFRQGLFNMTSDSHLFRTRRQLEDEGYGLEGNIFRRGDERCLPLYEAKMLHQFDHRWATYDANGNTRDITDMEKQDPNCVSLPRYWVPKHEVDSRLAGRWDRGWLLGWRDITNTTNERTVISALFARTGSGDTFLLAFPAVDRQGYAALFPTSLDSLICDYAARQKVGGTHLKYHVFQQLPVLPPSRYAAQCAWRPTTDIAEWMTPRVLELAYTAWDMQPFARDMGYDGPPFRWDTDRRFRIRCELDAAFFHLYEISREDVDYIMDTFPIVKRKDEARYDGRYRTKDTILEIYDAMKYSMDTGEAYQTALDPAPGDASLDRSLNSRISTVVL